MENRLLTDADLSRVASKVIPCGDSTIRRRFAIEYLGINHNEYKKIAYNQRDNCEEIVYESLQNWRERLGENGQDVTVQTLVAMFGQILVDEPGWISKTSYGFLIHDTIRKTKPTMPETFKKHGRYSQRYDRLMAEIADLQKEKEQLEEDRAKVQEKLRIKEEIAKAPFWCEDHLPFKRDRLFSNSYEEDFPIKKSRSF